MIKPIDVNEDKYPNSKAVILYKSVFQPNNLVTTPNTYEYDSASYFAGPDGDGYFIGAGVLPVETAMNCAAIVVKETTATTVAFLIQNDIDQVAYRTADIIDGVAMVEFDEVLATSVVAIFSEEADVYYISGGLCLEMTQPIYGGHSPSSLNQDTTFTTNKSVSGSFIGRTVENKYGVTEYSWRFLDPQWYRENFVPFRNHARTNPFFIKWRPDYHPDEASFCWTTDDIKAVNAGQGTTLVNASMSVECYSGI